MTVTKWEVQIFGRVPDSVIVEASTKQEALDKALQLCIEAIDFEAAPEDEFTAARIREREREEKLAISRRGPYLGRRRTNDNGDNAS